MLSHNRVRAQVNVELWRFISMGLCSKGSDGVGSEVARKVIKITSETLHHV